MCVCGKRESSAGWERLYDCVCTHMTIQRIAGLVRHATYSKVEAKAGGCEGRKKEKGKERGIDRGRESKIRRGKKEGQEQFNVVSLEHEYSYSIHVHVVTCVPSPLSDLSLSAHLISSFCHMCSGLFVRMHRVSKATTYQSVPGCRRKSVSGKRESSAGWERLYDCV